MPKKSLYTFTLPHKRRGTALQHLLVAVLLLCMVGAAAAGSFLYFQTREPGVARQTTEPAPAVMEEPVPEPPQPVTLQLPGAESFEVLREDYLSTDSLWKYVSKTVSIDTAYVPADLITPTVATVPGHTVRDDLVQPLEEMFAAAKAEGFDLMVGSAYRSGAEQKRIYDSFVVTRGQSYADQYSAVPGTSEHQLGLAVDISRQDRRCFLDETCFIATAEGQWLDANAWKYGFIVRYPEGKEAITGYSYESWHFRYVGKDLAAALEASGLTLDEAQPYLKTARDQLIERGFIDPR